MKERVAFAEQTEKEAFGGSFLWKAKVKTAPEPQCRRYSKPCRISALKNRICWNPKSEKSRWNRAFHD